MKTLIHRLARLADRFRRAAPDYGPHTEAFARWLEATDEQIPSMGSDSLGYWRCIAAQAAEHGWIGCCGCCGQHTKED